MATTIDVLDAFQDAIETALSMDCILGFPDLGRTGVSYPLGAIVFESDDYGQFSQQRIGAARIGQQQPAGKTVIASFWLVAANERALLTLTDSLRAAKVANTSVTAGGTKITVRWGATVRATLSEDGVTRDCVTRTEVNFTWI